MEDEYRKKGIGGEKEGWREMEMKGIKGLREKYIEEGKKVKDVMKENGLRYKE